MRGLRGTSGIARQNQRHTLRQTPSCQHRGHATTSSTRSNSVARGVAARLALGARVLATGRLSRITVAAPATTLAEAIAPFIATLGPGDPTPSAFASDGQDLERHFVLAGSGYRHGRPADLVRSLEIGVLPVWAYLPGAHQWATREAIDLTELTAETLIFSCRRHPADARRSTLPRYGRNRQPASTLKQVAAPSRRRSPPPGAE